METINIEVPKEFSENGIIIITSDTGVFIAMEEVPENKTFPFTNQKGKYVVEFLEAVFSGKNFPEIISQKQRISI